MESMQNKTVGSRVRAPEIVRGDVKHVWTSLKLEKLKKLTIAVVNDHII